MSRLQQIAACQSDLQDDIVLQEDLEEEASTVDTWNKAPTSENDNLSQSTTNENGLSNGSPANILAACSQALHEKTDSAYASYAALFLSPPHILNLNF